MLTSTYRIQLRAGTTLADLDDAVLDGLARLGVSHLYLSPVLRAAPGSTHGYDVVDPSRVDPELGGDEAFAALAARAEVHGLGLVVDIVPNHMAVHPRTNEWWWDVLRNGPASEHAPVFDIDWDSPERRLSGRLLLPVLDDHYGRELERGAFRLEHHAGELLLRHPSVELPIEPSSGAAVFEAAAEGSEELAFLAAALRRLPHFADGDPAALAARRRDQRVIRRRIAELAAASPATSAAIAEAVAACAQRLDDLDSLLDAQPYRLARWQEGVRDLGYRRFFDITSLIGVRVDDPEVFEATHRALRRWVEDGLVDGVRVDHPDGIADPGAYLQMLAGAAPRAWIVVEKILEGSEELPEWPVAGTTGYEAAEGVARAFLHPEGWRALRAAAGERDQAEAVAEEVVRAAKREVLRGVLAAELNRLTERLLALCEQRRRFRDFSRHELHECLVEVLSRLPVYRTYVPAIGGAGAGDAALVGRVLEEASAGRPDLDAELFELLRAVLVDPLPPGAIPEQEVRQRFQQLSGPAMAKGKEDTAWYRHVSLLSRNEVGGDADAPPWDLDEVHAWMAERQRRWPAAMTNLTTHDSKRSEDVRARLAVLAELGGAWVERSRAWHRRLEPLRRGGRPEPAVVEYVLQTIVGAWPLDGDRLAQHLVKAGREAKRHTSWLRPDDEYEELLTGFGRTALELLCDDLRHLDDEIRRPARIAALSQKLVQLCMPGVPDLYQGSERWHLRLTDPDNRVPVDLASLAKELVEISELTPGAGLGDAEDPGWDKLRLVAAALDLRRRRPGCFGAEGTYLPLRARGPRADHALAFVRGGDAVVVATRFPWTLGGDWGETTLELPAGAWVDAVTGRSHAGGTTLLADLCEPLGVALLERAP